MTFFDQSRLSYLEEINKLPESTVLKKIKETKTLRLMNGDVIEEEISAEEASEAGSPIQRSEIDVEETPEEMIESTLYNLADFVVESVVKDRDGESTYVEPGTPDLPKSNGSFLGEGRLWSVD